MFQRLLRKRRTPGGAAQAQPGSPVIDVGHVPKGSNSTGSALELAAFPGAAEYLDDGNVAAAVTVVQQARPDLSDVALSRIELQLMHEAFVRARANLPRREPPAPDPSPTSQALPEIPAAELDGSQLVRGVRGHGALLVRGLFPEAACRHMRNSIDAALAAFEGSGAGSAESWHVPLSDLAGDPLSPVYRANGYQVFDGQVSVADTPLAAGYILQQYRDMGLPGLVGEYLGVRPALSLEKWTLRRVPPTTNSSWHQDGAFLGEGVGTLNMWVALSECGESASGLDLVARRFDRIVPTGTDGAYFDWDVSPAEVERARGDSPIVSPVFAPGDAVFFDHFLLHRTGLAPNMTRDRYALESWFFDPQRFPPRYAGLLV